MVSLASFSVDRGEEKTRKFCEDDGVVVFLVKKNDEDFQPVILKTFSCLKKMFCLFPMFFPSFQFLFFWITWMCCKKSIKILDPNWICKKSVAGTQQNECLA